MGNYSIVLALFFCAVGAGAVAVVMLSDQKNRRVVSSLRSRRVGEVTNSAVFIDPILGKELERLDEEVEKTINKKEEESFALLLYRAGCFSPRQKRHFYAMKVWAPLIGGCVGVLLIASTSGFGSTVSFIFPVVCALGGFRYPVFRLESVGKARVAETLFYLPIVIEQLVIGVSSSLDIGPCIRKVIEMSEERNKSNPVIELLEQAFLRVRSGHSLDESLEEVGKLMGIPELKHALNAIAQVSRHGGEVTRQLKELADAITVQREVAVESVIKKLELKATLPVALAFLAFLATLFTGIACSLTSPGV